MTIPGRKANYILPISYVKGHSHPKGEYWYAENPNGPAFKYARMDWPKGYRGWKHTFVDDWVYAVGIGGRVGVLTRISLPYSPLYNCEMCGRLGSSKQVYGRGDCYSWDLPIGSALEHSKYVLCCACRNKVYPVAKALKDLNESKTIIGRIKKEILNGKKHPDNRAA